MRWVLHYMPEFERRWARFARRANDSWRMDETAISVRGGRYYLYRAVDRNGKSVESLLCGDRGMESALVFFRKAVDRQGAVWPSKINLDGNAASHRALRILRQEDPRWRSVTVRARRYLNNVIEQDHRAIKGRCAPMLGLKSYRTAAITLAGVELAHRIRKNQYSLMGNQVDYPYSLKQKWDRALSADAAAVRKEDLESPVMHQNSRGHRPEISSSNEVRSVRYPRKISNGGGLYMLVMPRGGRYWRFKYRYGGKHKTLALGIYPDVPVDRARARHKVARQLLAAGIDPACRRRELRKVAPDNQLAA
jgi:transposase-like protein